MSALELMLKPELLSLQQRFAREIARADVSGREHKVLVSVSTSTFSGSVIETIQPDDRTVGSAELRVPVSTRFDNGIAADSPLRRMAILFEVAAFVYALQDDRQLVVSVTLQDASDQVMDHVAQCYMGDDSKLVIKEQTIEDRSNG